MRPGSVLLRPSLLCLGCHGGVAPALVRHSDQDKEARQDPGPGPWCSAPGTKQQNPDGKVSVAWAVCVGGAGCNPLQQVETQSLGWAAAIRLDCPASRRKSPRAKRVLLSTSVAGTRGAQRAGQQGWAVGRAPRTLSCRLNGRHEVSPNEPSCHICLGMRAVAGVT